MAVIVLILVVLAVAAAVAVVVIRGRGERVAAPAAPPGEREAGGLRARLARTRSALGERLGSIFGRRDLDEAFWTDLEEALVAADIGVTTAMELVEDVRRRHPESGEEARALLEAALVELLSGVDRSLRLEGTPAVVLVVGVNGTGKTTTVAKLGHRFAGDGHRVVLAAADTFRAAATEQLGTWGERIGADVVRGEPGGDPAAVAYDALHRARSTGADVVLVDTAGRLHSKTNLMDELGKVKRVLERDGATVGDVLLVLDGTTGQNGIEQARRFLDAVEVTGLVVTKLDGTARGGVAVAIERTLGLPVEFIGVGEGVDDLLPFDPKAFVDALLEP